MITQINTKVTLKNGFEFVIVDIANVGGKEIALAAQVTDNFEKDPQVSFLYEVIKDGKTFLGCVKDKALIDEAVKKFKIRNKI